MRKIFLSFLFVGLVFVGRSEVASPSFLGPGFEFDASASDEFDGAALDESKWFDWVASFPGRSQGYLFARDNVAVKNGKLELTARLMREDEKTVENLRRGFDTYAMGMIKARRKTHYGYYECRAKTMHANVCNAFWLYDPLSDQPKRKFRPGDHSDEIDIFELFGKKETFPGADCDRMLFFNVHCLETPYLEGIVNSGARKLPNKAFQKKVDFDFWADYHVYGFLWTEEKLVWYVDGQEMFSRPNDVFKRPLHVTFNCEIKYTWTGEPDKADLPQSFSVDYFRYWKSPASSGADHDRKTVLRPESLEVAVAPQAATRQPVAWFAACEMTNFLSRAFGRAIPLVERLSPNRTAIVLGTNEWSVAAGVGLDGLARDGFVIRARPKRIFIAGKDAPDFRPFGKSYYAERATLYGAYDFLERFVGCRFYFPGELGEIVPRHKSIEVPVGDIVEAPDYTVRQMSHNFGAWFEPLDAAELTRIDRLQRYRLRHQTRKIPCCHGQYKAKFTERFAKTHPEYFRLRPDGTRWTEPVNKTLPPSRNSQMCHTSGIWEEVYKDARAYFRGEGPETRGLAAWGDQTAYGEYYDIMPQDCLRKCACENCQAAYAKAADPRQFAEELIWGHVADVANRLKAEGVRGTLTMMAYTPYRNVPEIDLPDNVAVMICSNGPWVNPERREQDLALVRRWTEKLGGKTWLWNNTGKHRCWKLDIEDLPCCTPRAFGRYYKDLKPLAFGAYCCNIAEKFLYSAINYYVYAKVSWRPETNVDALLAEYDRLMFGAAARPMRRFFDIIEEKWMTQVVGPAKETPVGTKTAAPSVRKVWTKIYPLKDVRKLGKLFDEAQKLVPDRSLEARRVKLFRREFFEPMLRQAEAYGSKPKK